MSARRILVVRSNPRAVVDGAIAGLYAAGITLSLLGVGTYCDRTPPCPSGSPCSAIRIVGQCGADLNNIALALIVGILAALGTWVLLSRRHSRPDGSAQDGRRRVQGVVATSLIVFVFVVIVDHALPGPCPAIACNPADLQACACNPIPLPGFLLAAAAAIAHAALLVTVLHARSKRFVRDRAQRQDA